MLWNPTSFVVYFLACWILLSALFTMSDEPFVYGTWPDLVAAAEGAFANLPGSLWKLVAVLSIITEEIIRDFIFSYRLCLFIIPLALTFSYREARGSRNGITTERKVWMQWYERQQSKNAQADSYFKKTQKTLQFMARHPMSLIVHLACWFLAFIFRYGDFLASMPILFVIIPALISSYQEAGGTVKGAAKEGTEWMKWYQRQTGAKAQDYTLAEMPPTLNAG